MAAKAIGSRRPTPNNSVWMYLVKAAAASAPPTTPSSVTRPPRRTNIQRTPWLVAPSAMRTPISLVRCVTLYDSTPYKPTAPSTSASAAARLTMSIVNERLAMALAARRFIVKMRYIGDVGMTSRMTARTSGSRWSARIDLMTYAGDAETAGRYTMGSGDARRRSSMSTSSTTPMTLYHWLLLA